MVGLERSQHVRSVLEQLDHTNPEHWTSQGVPRMDVLVNLGLQITRAELTQLAPGFRRLEPGSPPEGAPPGQPPAPPAAAQHSDPQHPERENPRCPRPEKSALVNEYACQSFIRLNAARAAQAQKEKAALREARGGATVRGTPLSALDQRISREARRARKLAARGQA